MNGETPSIIKKGISVELLHEVAVEWTDAGHLRHCTFVAMRDDKKPAEVVRETDDRCLDPS